MKRRFVAAMLAGVMACSLAGCNTKSPMAGKEEAATAADSQSDSNTQAAQGKMRQKSRRKLLARLRFSSGMHLQERMVMC